MLYNYFMKNPYAERSHTKMKEILLSPKSSGPKIHYFMIRGGKNKTNITVLESGKIGKEYIKTYGHYHVGKIEETYTILQGRGFVIMQKRKKDKNGEPINTEIKNFKAIKIKAGDKIFIPSEWGHLLVNTGKTWLVSSDNSPVNFKNKNPVSMPGHADYEPFKRLRGAGYYVTEKNNRPCFQKNQNYSSVPEIKL